MYIKSEKKYRDHQAVSKNGKPYQRIRKRTVHHFVCDNCKVSFEREQGCIDVKRLSDGYKHYCSNCDHYSLAAADGMKNKLENLRKRIGKKWVDACGYINVYMGPDYKGSGYCGSVREHILVMEQRLGRQLVKGEVVHHIDGDKTNNDIDNLQMMSVQEHNKCHATSESVVFELYKKGVVGYDRDTKRYFVKEASD